MRNFVIFFAVLSFFGCASQDSEVKSKTAKEIKNARGEKKAETKKKKAIVPSGNSNTELSDSLGDSLFEVDSTMVEEMPVDADSIAVNMADEINTDPDFSESSMMLEDSLSSEIIDEGELGLEDDLKLEDDLVLEEERLLSSQLVGVIYSEPKNVGDSLLKSIEQRISLEPEESSKQIVVEKWYSPVNFKGYKFNRRKLLLYGVSKSESVAIHYYGDIYYLSLRNRIFSLEESISTKNLVALRDTSLSNYLLRYEDKL